MMRIALGIEYDGRGYHGWQKQANLVTVQETLETALSKIAQEPIEVVCAGRTDTGVHASGQVIHFDTNVERNMRAWVFGTNSFLPHDICVRWAKRVPKDFHARYSAQSRTYRYIIYDQSIRPALFRHNVTWQYRALNTEKMQEAANHLIGEHDFSSFRSSDCQASTPIRHISKLTVTRSGHTHNSHHIQIEITANAFLHHMVRNIAGVLMAIGSEKRPSLWAKEVLNAKDRRLGGETAPPYGLYLIHVLYPSHFQIPESPCAVDIFG